MGFQNQRRVPFTVPHDSAEELHLMLGDGMLTATHRAVGLLGLEDDHLVIQLKDQTLEGRRSTSDGGGMGGWGGFGRRRIRPPEPSVEEGGVREVRIPFDDVASAHIKGWWKRIVTLTTNDLKYFDGLPGVVGDALTVHVARKFRGPAEDLVHDLQMRLSDLGMARLDARISRLEAQGEADAPRLDAGGGPGEDGS